MIDHGRGKDCVESPAGFPLFLTEQSAPPAIHRCSPERIEPPSEMPRQAEGSVEQKLLFGILRRWRSMLPTATPCRQLHAAVHVAMFGAGALGCLCSLGRLVRAARASEARLRAVGTKS